MAKSRITHIELTVSQYCRFDNDVWIIFHRELENGERINRPYPLYDWKYSAEYRKTRLERVQKAQRAFFESGMKREVS